MSPDPQSEKEGQPPPTPEELGQMLERGEITEEEANELMARRVQTDAFKNLYGPLRGREGGEEQQPEGEDSA